jgi:predicted dehydrogenase
MFNKNIFYDEAISEKTRLGEFSKYKNKVDSNSKFYPSSNDSTFQKERRRLIKGISLGIGTSVLGTPFLSFGSTNQEEMARRNTSPKQDGKLGIALVGLGQYSANELVPALLETEHCYLAGIVTGTPSKIPYWQEKYNIPEKNVYNYENFDQIANNPDIDIVYVVLPNSMHAEFTIRAAKAKKHVICEKPMATNVQVAQRMLDACRENGVQLAIGYRLHFEPFNKRVMELGQQEIFGKVKSIEAINTSDMTQGNPDVWRLRKDLSGGGSLMDIGIYCVQGACYTLGKVPIAVSAEFGEITKPTYFYEVEESISWKMDFGDGVVADCRSSYFEKETAVLAAKAENGWWRLDPAYPYDGKKGETHEGKMGLPNINEQAKQMDGQALSFKNNEKSIVPGEMGLRDMKILEAIQESAKNGGKRVELRL